MDVARKPSPSSIPRFSTPKPVTETSDKSTKKMRTSTPIGSDKTSGMVSSKPVVRAKAETATSAESKKGHEFSGARPKKVPPPPPPRKSSRLPGHVTPVATEVSLNGAVTVVSPPRGDMLKEGVKMEDASIVVGHQMGKRESGVVCTSTPKSSTLPKPLSKFEKGIVEGISAPTGSNIQYSSPLDEGPSQKSEKSHPAEGSSQKSEKAHTTEGPSQKTVERHSSESVPKGASQTESGSESSSSADSQRGTVILRCKNPPPKKPKPPPPQRKSSLSHIPKDEEEGQK